MGQTNTAASLALVKEDFHATLHKAVGLLEEWISNDADNEKLDESANELLRLASTAKLLNLPSLGTLLGTASQVLSSGAIRDLAEDKRASLATTILLTERYVDLIIAGGINSPEMLIEPLNSLQRFLKASPSRVYHWLDGFHPATEVSEYSADEATLRRQRIMLQTGLIALLQGESDRALLLLERATTRLSRMSDNADKLLWESSSKVMSAIHEVELPNIAKRQFRFLDVYLNSVIRKTATVESFNDAWGAICWLAAALRASDCEVSVSHFDGELPYSLAQLSSGMLSLNGVSVSTLDSVAVLVKEDIRHSKELLEIMSQSEANREVSRVDQLIGGLKRIANTLEMVGLGTVSVLVRNQINDILEASHGQVIDDPTVSSVADLLLYLDSCMDRLNKGATVGLDAFNQDARSAQVAVSLLDQTRTLALEEAKQQIVLLKQSLSNFIETGFDPEQIELIGPALETIRGVAFALNLTRAVTVVAKAQRFVNDRVHNAIDEGGIEPMLETFADALIGLEYYFDQLKYSESPDDKILDMADESLAAVGYAN